MTTKILRVVHLLTRPYDEREQRSIQTFSRITESGAEYVQVVNKLYTQVPPTENCARPFDVAQEPGYMKLSPAHYGCYLAHSEGIIDHIDNADALLILECDALLTVPMEEFMAKVLQALAIMERQDILMWTFGPTNGNVVESNNTYTLVNRFIEAHCYLIPPSSKEFMKNFFKDTKWDVIDIMYANNLTEQRIGVFNGPPISLQAKGYSFLDKKFSLKNWLGIEKL